MCSSEMYMQHTIVQASVDTLDILGASEVHGGSCGRQEAC